jgi:hypothetical protein
MDRSIRSRLNFVRISLSCNVGPVYFLWYVHVFIRSSGMDRVMVVMRPDFHSDAGLQNRREVMHKKLNSIVL